MIYKNLGNEEITINDIIKHAENKIKDLYNRINYYIEDNTGNYDSLINEYSYRAFELRSLIDDIKEGIIEHEENNK